MEVDAGYQIVRSIRDRCVFALQNLASDPPFSRMDLISCRNLLIYLGAGLAATRDRHTLFYACSRTAYCCSAARKDPGHLAEYFTPLDSRAQDLYLRKPAAARPGFELPARVATFPVFRPDENPPAAASKGRRTTRPARCKGRWIVCCWPNTRRPPW